MRKKGILVSFEGIDKSGKSTQIEMLRNRLNKKYRTKTFSALKNSFTCIKRILLDRKYSIDARTELLLYMTDRCRMTSKLFKPINEGKIVIVDRYIDSSIVYQGAFRKLNVDFIHQLNEFVTFGLKPDITFILDIPKEEYLKRINAEKKDRLEVDVEKAYDTIRNAYIQVASTDTRYKIIKATSITETNDIIYNILQEKIAMPK